jgi:hypothetical protein
MVPWWKRLIYSLASAMVGAGLSGACIAAQEFVASSHGRISAMGLLTAILFFDGWLVVLSLPGWLLAIPVVLLVTNIDGWRFWMYLAIGICFGPALIFAASWFAATRGLSLAGFAGGSMSLVYIAGAVSGLATLFYLFLLRRAQARHLLRTTV